MTKTKQPKKEITIEDIFDLFKESEKKFQVHLKEEEKREEKREEREEKADRERKREQKEWNKRFSEYSQSQ
jgi:lipoate-protein ligase A